jgi:hypothetical protein
VITDSIHAHRSGARVAQHPAAQHRVADGEAMRRITDEASVSSLFD